MFFLLERSVIPELTDSKPTKLMIHSAAKFKILYVQPTGYFQIKIPG